MLVRFLRPVVVEALKGSRLEATCNETALKTSHLESKLNHIELKTNHFEALDKMVSHVVVTPIDLVRHGDYLIYVYTEDAAYQTIATHNRRQKQESGNLPQPADPALAARYYEKDFLNEPADHIHFLKLAGAHLWHHGQEFDYVDVGAKEGSGSIRMADWMRRCSKNGLLYAFEPAMGFPLLRANVKVNKLDDRIIAENQAVGNINSYTVMSLPVGHTEGGSAQIYTSAPPHRFFYRMVPICRLDTYFSAQAENKRSYVIKIDAEGFDADILYGLEGIASQVPAIVFEYTMHSMRGQGVDPADALQFLHKKGFLLFNCWQYPEGAEKPAKPCLEEINPEDIASLRQFFQRLVEQHRCEQTDILAISRNLPNHELLLTKIRQMISHP